MDDDAELAAMMRDSELSRERGEFEEEGDEANIPGERDPLRRSEGASFSSTSGTTSQWNRRLNAFFKFCDVFVEIGRRLLRLIELNVPRYIAFVDRCLVHVIRVSVHPRKRVNTLRLLLTILLIASIPYLIVTMYRVQLTLNADQDSVELTEDRIRPIIIIEHVEEPTPTRRQAMLRNGGDGLRSDHVDISCANTRQGAVLLTDATGHVCTRRQLDHLRPGCCNEMDASLPRIKQFTCDSCDTRPPHCCNIYEHCVSCCMHPLNVELRQDYLTHVDPSHPLYQDPGNLTVFEYCANRCRTSSSSIQHQNSYRSRRKFCYGIHRPLRVLPTVNSDGGLLLSEMQETSEPVLASQLEIDPFYRRSR